MSYEITVTAKLSASKNSVAVTNATSSAQHDMTGDNAIDTRQTIDGTGVADAIETGDIDTASNYWVLIRNLSDTYDVKVALDSADPFTKQFAVIPPEGFLGPMQIPASAAVYVRNSSGDATTSDIEVVACEA